MTDHPNPTVESQSAAARAALGKRNLILIGLMGAGKSSVGKIVAQELGLPFIDSDAEIERVSRMTIPELFAAYGEQEFRALETRVMKRILRSGPRVVSTGGGAYINDKTRKAIEKGGTTLWLKAELDVLWERVSKRDNRPLLKTENPKKTLEDLMNSRYPIYAGAAITVMSRDVRKEVMAQDILSAIIDHQQKNRKTA